ncbi:LOW QUALITY PROTEIN: hypothetical protein U9M48_032225, partial [Paspalum notatum var. saurae]
HVIQEDLTMVVPIIDAAIVLPFVGTRRAFPQPLQQLVQFDGDSRSNRFMRLIRQYNSLFAFTSLGVDIEKSINTGDGPYVFRINGLVHHRIGSLVPPQGKRPEYAWLYIHNTQNEIQNRLNIFSSEGEDVPDPQIVSFVWRGTDGFRQMRLTYLYNLLVLLMLTVIDIVLPVPLTTLLIGGPSPEVSSFDIVVETLNCRLKPVSPIHPALMALQYPLLFPYGEPGFHTSIKFAETADRVSDRDEASMYEYYGADLHYRPGQPNPALCSGRLSQQYQVNAYSCVEANKLNFYYFNQDLLRCETYQGISDAVGHGTSIGADVGVKKTLPASHIGGKRYIQQNYHDYIVVRVFHMKLEEYLTDIKEGRVFGPVRAGQREQTAEDVDKYISAELPDPKVDPLGFSLVQEFMIHGPCGRANPSSQ